MPVKKIVSKTDLQSISEVKAVCDNMTIDNQYKLERTKNPASKRQAKANISFWGSASFYLRMVEAMTDDEVQQIESRIAAQKGGENG